MACEPDRLKSKGPRSYGGRPGLKRNRMPPGRRRYKNAELWGARLGDGDGDGAEVYYGTAGLSLHGESSCDGVATAVVARASISTISGTTVAAERIWA